MVVLRELKITLAAAIAALAVVVDTGAQPPAITTLMVNGRSNATPSIAADGEFVVVAFGATTAEGATDVFTSVSRDGARTFQSPIRVNDVAGDARLNGEQPPRVALVHRSADDPAITIVWTTKGKNGTKLVSARSADGGRSYAAATTVRDSDAAGNRGWENVAATSSGDVLSIWLDHREMANHSMGSAPSHDHAGAPPMDGAAMAQQSKLFIGTLDGLVAPHAVTGGVCYCCKTAIAATNNGGIAAAWRHVYPGNFRDIAFTISTDGGRSFAPPLRISEDKWMLDGCPDDGPALAIDARNTIHVVWPTLVTGDKTGEPTIAIFYAQSSDGRTFTARRRVPTQSVAHHPQIVVDARGTPVIAWDESGNGVRRVVGAVAGPTFTRFVVNDSGGVYPALARTGQNIAAVWTLSRPTGSVVQTAIVSLHQ